MKYSHTLKTLLFAFSIFLFGIANGQIVTTTTLTPQQLVQDVLLGQGIQAFNIQYTGYSRAIGHFTALNTGLGIDSGVVLTSGTVLNNDSIFVGVGPQGPNTLGSSTAANGRPGDADLDLIVSPNSTLNAAVLEFDFIPLADSVKFKYVFGSEEFSEFVNSSFNDAFAFILSGVTVALSPTNIALIPNTTTPVTINNVNNGNSPDGIPSSGPCNNCAYFRDNYTNGGLFDVQYDGLTAVLTALYPVQCGETYHIKIAIADVGDEAFDSGVFLQAGSFSAGTIDVSSDISYGGPNDSTLFEGCGQACLIFSRQGNINLTDTIALTFTGNAINGVDFIPAIPSQIIFQPGQDSVVICITAVQDLITEGLDTLNIGTTVSGPCFQSASSATIYIGDFLPLDVNAGPDTALCSANPITITANTTGGVQPYNYQWSTGDTTQSITVAPSQTTSYIIEVTDPCGSPVGFDTVTVYLPNNGPLSITTSPDYDICAGESILLDVTASGGSSPYTYTWTTSVGPDLIPNPSSPTNQFIPTANGTFVILVREGCGTTRLDSITVALGDCDVIPPNVFTPNGDGQNDVLSFKGLEDFPGSALFIYNRWGNKVYETTDYRNDWTGGGVSDGTYYYVLNVNGGKALHGFIMILKDK